MDYNLFGRVCQSLFWAKKDPLRLLRGYCIIEAEQKGGAGMLISTKGRYAMRVMIDLAEHMSDGFIPLKAIAQRQDISEKYLESIIKLLVRARLLSGQRGKGGGYRLTRPPEAYTAREILELTEACLAPVACLEPGAGPCPSAAYCRTLPLWRGLDRVITEYLNGVSLADLMQKTAPGNDYVI